MGFQRSEDTPKEEKHIDLGLIARRIYFVFKEIEILDI